jgi:hypothetical protein
MDLLFILCTWHALAKLRLHTETTLHYLKEATVMLGQHLRRFVKITCSAFETKDLPSEEAARGRRKAAVAGKRAKKPKKDVKGKQKDSSTLRKLFNLCTYKLHALGDYVVAILQYGTTDNFTTQVVRFPMSLIYLLKGPTGRT